MRIVDFALTAIMVSSLFVAGMRADDEAAHITTPSEIPASLDPKFRPVAGVEYTLAASSLYRPKPGSDPGPAARDTSIAWAFANEFVYRTALANEYVVPAGGAGPTKDDWFRVSFSAKDGKSRELVVEVDIKRRVGRLAAEAPSEPSVALSLRLAAERDGRQVEIFVKNVSHAPVEITSKGIAPPWSVWAWFKWKVDGADAEYVENVAVIPENNQSWRIPPGGVVFWGTIPLRAIRVNAKTGPTSAIQDSAKHTLMVLPGQRWKDLTVKPGFLEIPAAPAPSAPAK